MARGGKREGAGRKKIDEEKKKITKSFRINQELLIGIEKKFPNLALSSIIESALSEYLKKSGGEMDNKILVRRKKINGEAGKLDKYTVTQLTKDVFIKVSDTLEKMYFVPKNKIQDYFTDDDTTKDIFTAEEWENLKEVCKDNNGLLNGNIYLQKLDLIETIESICSFFLCKQWIQSENYYYSIIKDVYKEYYQELEKNLSKEEIEELEKIVKFTSDEDNYNRDFSISK